MPQLIASVEGVEIRHVFIEKDRTTLGRKPHNDIVFDNMIVSGAHCAFDLEGLADVYIEDLASTNGTYINGQMIKARQKLNDHDVIAIGNFVIEFLAASGHEKKEDHNKTSAMSLSSLSSLGFPGTTGRLQASLKVLAGSSAGLEIPVVKAVTTFGERGVAMVSISHRREGYYVSHLEGDGLCTLNGVALGDNAVALADHDVLELAETALEFVLKGV